jgi:hypothetical protein
VPLVFDDAIIDRLATQAAADSPRLDAIRRALADCVEKLSPEHRELIVIRYEPAARVGEIAENRSVTPKALSETLQGLVLKRLAARVGAGFRGGFRGGFLPDAFVHGCRLGVDPAYGAPAEQWRARAIGLQYRCTRGLPWHPARSILRWPP